MTVSDIDRKLDVDDSDDTDPTTTTDPTSSLIQTTNGAGTQTIGGLATGLDTNAIIAALVASERALENPIKNQARARESRCRATG